MLVYRRITTIMGGLLGLAFAQASVAQVPLDRADPTIIEQALPKPSLEDRDRPVPTATESATQAVPVANLRTRVLTAVTVVGADDVPMAAYADIIAPVLGQDLDRTGIQGLASGIAGVVRSRGYPFATASVEPQSLANGVLRVTVDQGKIDAVRVVGARNSAADALLVRALVTHRAATRGALERALSLVADVPGVRVVSTRYVRQDGFGILLVTIAQDRASAYAQIDNRGSREVGPVRSTLLGSLRSLVSDGDELGLIVAQTPVQPSEFAFLRARYGAPVDASGSVLAVSASYGRSHPGASLSPLGVIGRSGDVAVTYTRPLLRRRVQSLWAAAEFRAVSIEQMLAGRQVRNDRLATLTGTLNGFTGFGGGTLRGDVSLVAGLPLAGITREGDARTSRPDGDGRFVAAGYQVDWTVRIARPVAVVIASAGQLASRPLLATAEIGLGGPGFARGYDYAERTGDKGIMGSVEVRADAGRLVRGVIDRAQFYGFADGGVVGNLRGGFGGGSLASIGTGLRAGTGRLDGMVEVAFPLNKDRFDTGDRRPRISLRLSRSF